MKRTKYIVFLISLSLFFTCSVLAKEDVYIHGFVSQGYMQSSDNNFLTNTEDGSFEFNELGINFSTNVTSNLKIGMQLFARDLGNVGNDEIVVDWAFGDYSWREWMGFRAGILKAPLGLYNDTRDVDTLRTSILLPQGVYNEWFRDMGQGLKGVEVYGNISLKSAGLLQYELKYCDVVVGLDSGTSEFIKLMNPVFTSVDEINVDKIYLGALKWHTPLEGLLVGLSGFKTNVDYLVNSETLVSQSKANNLIYSLEYSYDNLVLMGEMSVQKRERTAFPVANPAMKILDNDKTTATHYYIGATYRFLDWLELGTYYSVGVGDDDESGAVNELKDIALSSKFDLNEYFSFKLEGHKMDGLFGVGNNEDGTNDEDWYLFAAKVSYTF